MSVAETNPRPHFSQQVTPRGRQKPRVMSSILLRGGTVVDGSGEGSFVADVTISNGRIQSVGRVPKAEAELVLDVGGLTVAPGFIDSHSHAEAALLRDPLATPKVAQGVTTEIVNNCGFGLFPVRSEAAREAMSGIWTEGEAPVFASAAEYRDALLRQGAAVNVAALIPHGAVRTSVVGADDRPARDEEIRAMCDLAREAFRQGAVGISFGLLYAPGCFTPKEEIVSLGRVAAEFGRPSATLGACPEPAERVTLSLPLGTLRDPVGVLNGSKGRPLAFHVRNECDGFEQSILEAIEIGGESSAAVHISHLKVADPTKWGQVGIALRHIEEANARGQRVTCDQYPYTAGSSPFTTLLPPWALEGGIAQTISRLRNDSARRRISASLAGDEPIPGWDNLSSRIGWDGCVVGSAPGLEQWEGKSIADLARSSHREPHDLLFDLLLTTHCAAIGIWHQMCEEDVQTVMRHPAQMIGSDGLHTPGRPHPRLWGTFPRVLGRYVRELGVLTLEQAIHKMTGKTAATFGLKDRGLIRPGYHADICVFNPDRIADRATWDEPTLPPDGIVHVICNGVLIMLDGRRTEHRPGDWLS